MKHLFKQSTVAVLIAAFCAACNPLSELETQKEKLLEQLKQCPAENTTEESSYLNECQSLLVDDLKRVEEEIYKAKFGSNYSRLEPYEHGYWIALNGSKIGFLDPEGKEVISPEYEELAEIKAQYPAYPYPLPSHLNLPNYMMEGTKYLFPVVYLQNSEGKWGAIHLETGKEVAPFKYKMPELIRDDYVLLTEYSKDAENAPQLVIDKKGNVLLDPRLYDDFYVTKGVAIVFKNDKLGVVRNQKEIIPPRFEVTPDISNNFIITHEGNLNTIYSLEGEKLAEVNGYVNPLLPEGASILYLKDNNISDSKIINDDGEILFNNVQGIDNIADNIFSIKKDDKMGVIDLKGNLLLDFKYDYITYSDSRKHSIVSLDGKKGLIDEQAKFILPTIYNDIRVEKDKILVTIGDCLNSCKKGMFSLKGEELLPVIYDNIYINTDVINVKKEGKIALYSLDLKPITSFKFDEELFKYIDYYSNKKDELSSFTPAIIVKVDGKVGLITPDGKEIFSPKYQALEPTEEFFIFKINDKYGVMDSSEKIIIQPIYDGISFPPREDANGNVNKGYFIVQDNGLQGIINMQGDIVIPINYDKARTIIGLDNVFSVAKDNKWALYNLTENKAVTDFKYDEPFSSKFADVNDAIPSLYFSQWHQKDITFDINGNYLKAYQQRVQDNQTKFGFELLPEMEISNEQSKEGNKEFHQLKSLLDKTEPALDENEKIHVFESFMLPDEMVDNPSIIDNYIEARKHLASQITALSIKDPEVALLANRYLSLNYMVIQFLEASKKMLLQPKHTFYFGDNNQAEKPEESYTLNKINVDFLLPKSIAEAEMKEVMEKLERKYQ